MNTTTDPRNIETAHCRGCGATDDETMALTREAEGYTPCCNEWVTGGGRDYMNRPERCTPETCYHD